VSPSSDSKRKPNKYEMTFACHQLLAGHLLGLLFDFGVGCVSSSEMSVNYHIIRRYDPEVIVLFIN
jgi:hypothetical protein